MHYNATPSGNACALRTSVSASQAFSRLSHSKLGQLALVLVVKMKLRAIRFRASRFAPGGAGHALAQASFAELSRGSKRALV